MKKNQYPLHIEKQYEKLWQKVFGSFAAILVTDIKRLLGNEEVSEKQDSVRLDSDIFDELERLQQRYGDLIDSQDLENELKTQFAQMDAWTKDQVSKSLDKEYQKMKNPPKSITGVSAKDHPDHAGFRFPTIDIMNRRSGVIHERLEKRIAENINLIKGLQKKHIHDIHRIVTDGVTKGRSTASIANELMGLQRSKGGLIDREIKSKIRGEITRVTSIHENQARFWARDQVSKALSEINRMRQEMAGFSGYIWRTMQDMKVRDTHESLEGTYHEWSNPPVIVRSTGAVRLHPGEDYNCRCWPEAAMGPDEAKPTQKKVEPVEPDEGIVQVEQRLQIFKSTNQPIKVGPAKLNGTIVAPRFPDGISEIQRNKYQVVKRLDEFIKITIADRIMKIKKTQTAEWEIKKLNIYKKYSDQDHDFSDFGMDIKDAGLFIRSNYDRVFVNYFHGRKRLFMYNRQMNGVTIVDEHSNKIVGTYRITENFNIDSYMSDKSLEVK